MRLGAGDNFRGVMVGDRTKNWHVILVKMNFMAFSFAHGQP